ncbi:MAG: glycerol kinase GlpK [Alphaproteobacteria bacterium]
MGAEGRILAIDQGTTSTRAMVFDGAGRALKSAGCELAQIFPKPGWVEHDPEEIWQATLAVCREAMVEDVVGIGITNQRETTVIWDRADGKPIYNAIVWQDRRTAETCARLRDEGKSTLVTEATGLVLDPYFSASKIGWLLDNVPGARARAEAGDLAFGTIDCFLLWRLTGGAVHATDATNACRTMLFNIHAHDWDDALLALFDIPRGLLPVVMDNAAAFGTASADHFGRALPIGGMAGDQHAATVGQACFAPGMIKSTYGTGCFAVLNTGYVPVPSRNRMLTTLAYRLEGRTSYALEGSIFVAGAAVQWLRDGLGVISSAEETEALAAGQSGNGGVYMVPAFTGLGAPYWDAEARGAILGLTRDSGVGTIVRAALEAVCYQTHDLVSAMAEDMGQSLGRLRVDGGMVANDWLMQFLTDIVDLPVDRPVVSETTALGAAYLAGLQLGVYDSLDVISAQWQRDREFTPGLAVETRNSLLAGWQDAVARVLTR